LIAFLLPSMAANPIGVFDFDLRGKDPAEQIRSLDGIGFDGVTVQLNQPKDVLTLDAYLQEKPDLRVFAGLIHINIDSKEPFSPDHIRTCAKKLSAIDAKIWLILSGSKDKTAEVQAAIDGIARIAGLENCGVSLYPHDHTAVETAEEMLVYLKKSKQQNLTISLHQCHELRAGNIDRIDEIMSTVGPHIDMVTLCGSDRKLRDDSPDWSDAIKPLGEGDYDPKDFLRVLKKHQFNGPIILHTFGLKERPASHYQTSHDLLKKMWRELAAEPS
jgi:sugar phosphate isomerase/epimerase